MAKVRIEVHMDDHVYKKEILLEGEVTMDMIRKRINSLCREASRTIFYYKIPGFKDGKLKDYHDTKVKFIDKEII